MPLLTERMWGKIEILQTFCSYRSKDISLFATQFTIYFAPMKQKQRGCLSDSLNSLDWTICYLSWVGETTSMLFIWKVVDVAR